MEQTGENTPQLFTQADTGDFVEYVAPEAPAFKDTLPEDIRESEHLSEVEDGSQLARYYVDLKKDYLAPPENAEGYEFEAPEGLDVNEEALSQFRNVAFENGVNQKQFAALVNYEATRQKATMESLKTAREGFQAESEKTMKEKYGVDYEKNIESAKRFLNHESFADGEFKQFLEDTRFGDHPKVIDFMVKLSDLISEDHTNKPGQGSKEPELEKGEDGKTMLKFPSMDKK